MNKNACEIDLNKVNLGTCLHSEDDGTLYYLLDTDQYILEDGDGRRFVEKDWAIDWMYFNGFSRL